MRKKSNWVTTRGDWRERKSQLQRQSPRSGIFRFLETGAWTAMVKGGSVVRACVRVCVYVCV